MPTILSTKILTKTQKIPLLEAGFEVEEHDFIRIEPVDFSLPRDAKTPIFTSQNAVKQVMGYALGGMSCFCVGQKTKALLEKKGIKVIATAAYGKDLAKIIVEKYPNESFTFFCGNRRREELPSILKENKVSFEEVEVYKTRLNPKHFKQEFDGVLFFSPSGVESFCSKNEFKQTTAFCIGTTTAAEARKYTNNIIVAKEPTVESVIMLTHKILPEVR